MEKFVRFNQNECNSERLMKFGHRKKWIREKIHLFTFSWKNDLAYNEAKLGEKPPNCICVSVCVCSCECVCVR